MFWFVLFGLSYLSAWKAMQAQKFIKANPSHPMAYKATCSVGLYYLQAIVVMGIFPWTMAQYTDHLLVHIAVWVPALLVGAAAWREYYFEIEKANDTMRIAFYSMAICIVIMSVMVPEGAYDFPAPVEVEADTRGYPPQ